MRKFSELTAFALLISFLVGWKAADGQVRYRPDSTHKINLSKTWGWFEWDALLNPIYVTQYSSKYKLNGHVLPITPTPRFYALQTGQNAFLSSTPFSLFNNINTTFDQSNAYYGSLRLWFLDNSPICFFRNMRLLLGVTHDKLQTISPTVMYRLDNGGTEATMLLEKNLSFKLSDLDFSSVNLIFSCNVQAGILFSLAGVKTRMNYGDSIIQSADSSRLQWPSFNNGWGWQGSANMEVGGVLCHQFFISRSFTRNCPVGHALFWFFKHLGITAGTRVMVEKLYSSPEVLVNGKPGYRLRVSNFGVFFAGPVINIKWLSLK